MKIGKGKRRRKGFGGYGGRDILYGMGGDEGGATPLPEGIDVEVIDLRTAKPLDRS